jgi:hypothetical protein
MKSALALLLLFPVAAVAADPSVRSACGGITAEERRALPSQVPDANLELLFVAGKRGAYVAGVEWRVLDRSNEPLAYGRSEGPQCFLRVPDGPLRVEARLRGEMKSAKANAGARRQRLVFNFAPEADEDVEASPEEKEQGRR